MIKIEYVYILLILILLVFVICTIFSIIIINDNFVNLKDNLTVVSGYWMVKNKYGKNKYDEWFNNTLKINQRYIFFTPKENFTYIKQFRHHYETDLIDYNFDQFYSKNIYDAYTHTIHVPSKEIGYIWNEKIHLMKLAKDLDKQKNQVSEFYIWIDAGIYNYRSKQPPPQRLIIKDLSLPKDKLIYSKVNESYHEFSGGVLLMHNTFIDKFHDIYYEYLKNCKEEWKCGSDQYIYTTIKKENPQLFHQIKEEGYGKLLDVLYNDLF